MAISGWATIHPRETMSDDAKRHSVIDACRHLHFERLGPLFIPASSTLRAGRVDNSSAPLTLAANGHPLYLYRALFVLLSLLRFHCLPTAAAGCAARGRLSRSGAVTATPVALDGPSQVNGLLTARRNPFDRHL